jgi:NADH-quinone oxidoreductase subunit I
MVSPVSSPVGGPRRSNPVAAYFGNIQRAVSSTFEGLTVTMSWMFRRPSTIQYPDRMEQSVQDSLPDTYRGVLEVDLDRCTACMLCQKSCPLGCISIETCKHPEGGRAFQKFDIDIGLCMYCGLCAEACGYDALVHTTEFEASVTNPDQLMLRFVDRDGRIAAKAKDLPPRRKRGSIIRAMIPTFGRRHQQAMPPSLPRPEPVAPEAPAPATAPVEPERPEGTA